MFAKSVLGLAALATMAVADVPVPNYGSALNMTIDPNSVDAGTRNDWCASQSSACRTLCNNNAQTYSCDSTTLKYDCTCASNHSAPGLQYYAGTIPTNICNMLYQNCITGNTDNAQEQNKCKPNIGDLCGKLAPGSAVIASSTAATSSKPSATQSGASESGSGSTSSSKAFAAPTTVPLGAAAIAGVFAYML